MARILVVEDNLALAEGVAYNLRHEGHDVRIAEDGEAGLAETRAWDPSLVILDLMLPRLDGYGVLSAIRRHPRFPPERLCFQPARGLTLARAAG